jgi:hypothetical protein
MLESFIQKFGTIGTYFSKLWVIPKNNNWCLINLSITIQTFVHEFEKLGHNNFHKRNYLKTCHILIMNEKWTMMVSSYRPFFIHYTMKKNGQ